MNIIAKPAPDLDPADLRILMLIQKDNTLSHAAIGGEVGLSTSAVRRRIRAMERNGTIIGNISVVEPEVFGVTLILELAFVTESKESYEALDRVIEASPNIQQSYHVAGDVDYMLVVHGPSLRWYEQWVHENFTCDANIKRVNTRVVWSRRKFDPSVALNRDW